MKKGGYIFLVLIVLSCTLSYFVGVSANEFDVWNYHLYSPFALLNGRIGYDMMPAGVRSYFNPLLDIPYYLMIKFLNNYGGIVSILQGLYYAFFACSLFLFNSIFLPKQRMMNFLAVLISMSGVFFVAECGSTFNDLQPATLILLSLYFLLKKYNMKNFIISGLLCGIAVGLKLTMIPFVVAFIGILIVGVKRFGLKNVGGFIISLLGGAFLSGGIWYIYIWKLFKNPVFPYFNGIFKSEYYEFENLLSDDFNRYKQGSFIESFFKYPFLVCTNLLKTEPKYKCFDLRIPFLFILMFLNFIRSVFIKKLSFKFKILILWSVISYSLWIVMYSNLRYLLPVLALIGLVVVLFVKAISKNAMVQNIILIMFIVLFFFTTKYSHIRVNKTIPINKPVYNVKTYPDLKDDSLVLLASHATVGVALWQNPNVQYAQLVLPAGFPYFRHWSQHLAVDYVRSDYYYDKLKKMIATKKGNIYIVFIMNLYNIEGGMYQNVLKGLLEAEPKFSTCQYLTAGFYGGHIMCKLD